MLIFAVKFVFKSFVVRLVFGSCTELNMVRCNGKPSTPDIQLDFSDIICSQAIPSTVYS